MKLKGWLAAMASAMTLAWIAVPAQAGSASVAGALQAGTKPSSEVQLAHWRGRGYYYGYRPYRRYYYGPRYRHRYYNYGPRYHHRRHWRYHRYW
jgi:hypothetical protein